MTRYTANSLFDLLPAVYRQSDAESGGALRSLLEVIARELEVVQFGLDSMHDNQFVETAADWIVPYLGELIGYSPLPAATSTVSPRADLANTVAYRRRKGTALLLERLARDVTGWPARVEESFSVLVWRQHARHVRNGTAGGFHMLGGAGGRLVPGGTASVRDHIVCDESGGAFDLQARYPEARRITATANGEPTDLPAGGPGAPRPSTTALSLRLYTEQAVRTERARLTPVLGSATHYRFDLLGRDHPLYQRARYVPEDTPTPSLSVPRPLTRRDLADHLEVHYGANGSIELEWQTGNAPAVEVRQLVVASDLSDVAGLWAHEPAPGFVAIDPELGRIAFGDPPPEGAVLLASSYDGRPAGFGAGNGRAGERYAATAILKGGGSLAAAVAQAVGMSATEDAVVEVVDEAIYEAPPAIAAAAHGKLTVAAGAGTRPFISASIPLVVASEPGSEVVLEGLVIAGAPLVVAEAGDLEPRTLRLRDCTLVPGLSCGSDGKPQHPEAASLLILHPLAKVILERCVLGPVVAVEGARVELIDCVVDAGSRESVAYAGRGVVVGGLRTVNTITDAQPGLGEAAGAGLSATRCTVWGRVHAVRLEASNTLFVARPTAAATWPATLWVRRRQEGCVRFCYLPAGARVPRRFRCLDGAQPGLAPIFDSRSFGSPRYAGLHPATVSLIRRGANDGGEIGASNSSQLTHREDNLAVRLQEYLRFGMEVGFSRA